MNRCQYMGHIQDYLDALMPEVERRAFEAHLAGCAACSADVSAFRDLFASIAAAPLAEPRAGLTDRVMDRVLADARARRRCGESRLVQDYLDDLLPQSVRRGFEVHLTACEHCAHDLAAYRSLFETLRSAPLHAPAEGFVERVLARVLPSRVRVRWVRALGWAYAATFAALIGGVTLWIAQPGSQEALGALSGAASSRLAGVFVGALQLLALAAQGIAAGWGIIQSVVSWFAPLHRALSPWITNPTVMTALAAAGIACTWVVAWMRSQVGPHADGRRHVAIVWI